VAGGRLPVRPRRAGPGERRAGRHPRGVGRRHARGHVRLHVHGRRVCPNAPRQYPAAQSAHDPGRHYPLCGLPRVDRPRRVPVRPAARRDRRAQDAGRVGGVHRRAPLARCCSRAGGGVRGGGAGGVRRGVDVAGAVRLPHRGGAGGVRRGWARGGRLRAGRSIKSSA
jgi:hypothetical protein